MHRKYHVVSGGYYYNRYKETNIANKYENKDTRVIDYYRKPAKENISYKTQSLTSKIKNMKYTKQITHKKLQIATELTNKRTNKQTNEQTKLVCDYDITMDVK